MRDKPRGYAQSLIKRDAFSALSTSIPRLVVTYEPHSFYTTGTWGVGQIRNVYILIRSAV